MENKEKNKLNMYNAVSAVTVQHQASVDALVPLSDSVKSFKDTLREIGAREREFTATYGATAAKNSASDTMTEKAFSISNALYSLARKTGNLELKEATKDSITDIGRLRENELEQYCTRILSLAKANADALLVYTITPEAISSLEQSLDTFRKQSDSKDTKFAGRKAAREVLFDLFAKADEILREDIDTLMELIKTTNNDFYNQYKAARTIKDLGGSQKSNTKPADAIIVTEEKVVAPAK